MTVRETDGPGPWTVTLNQLCHRIIFNPLSASRPLRGSLSGTLAQLAAATSHGSGLDHPISSSERSPRWIELGWSASCVTPEITPQFCNSRTSRNSVGKGTTSSKVCLANTFSSPRENDHPPHPQPVHILDTEICLRFSKGGCNEINFDVCRSKTRFDALSIRLGVLHKKQMVSTINL